MAGINRNQYYKRSGLSSLTSQCVGLRSRLKVILSGGPWQICCPSHGEIKAIVTVWDPQSLTNGSFKNYLPNAFCVKEELKTTNRKV